MSYCLYSCQSVTLYLLRERKWLLSIEHVWKIPLICSWGDSVGVHVAAHLVNALNFSVNYSEDFVELNAARYRDEVGGLCLLIFLSLVLRWLMKGCDFHRKFVPCCSFWVLLKYSCQVEFYSFSIENIGNYYFTVSPAENRSSENIWFSYPAMFR